MKTQALLLTCLLSLVACDQPKTAPAPAAPVPPTKATTKLSVEPSTLSKKTPLDFGAAWRAILETQDPAQASLASVMLRQAWLGKRYRWTGATVAGLCLDATRTCSINVFPRKSDPHLRWLGGFFPTLEMTPKAWAAFREGCATKNSCVLDFEATLRDMRADLDAPLKLEFADAKVFGARAERAEEGWFVTPIARKISEEQARENRRHLRTGNPVVPPTSLTRSRAFTR